jgi:hypothetical protein
MVADINESLREELVRVARTATGDDLRSVVYFDPETFEQLYLRAELEHDADVSTFVDYERHGFEADATYGDSELGEYRFTIRAFDYGYITCVVGAGHGVFVTTDELSIDRFEEVASALTGVLREH